MDGSIITRAPQGGPKTAFLIYSNVLSKRVLQQIAKAEAELGGSCDVHVIGYFPDAATAPAAFGSNPRYHAYDQARMETMGYPLKGRPFHLMPGNTDMPILAFARDNPRYDTVWLFENDVAFTGPLSSLIEAFADSPADLLTTSIAPPPDGWAHMVATVIPEGWSGDVAPIRAFLPVFRASRRFLADVDGFYCDGGDGHYEQIWPYVALARGLELEDFGGQGQYVKPGNRNRFYTSTPETPPLYPGTFRYRPPRRHAGTRPMTLWHPVKEKVDMSLLTEVKVHVRLTGRWLVPAYLRRRLRRFLRANVQ